MAYFCHRDVGIEALSAAVRSRYLPILPIILTLPEKMLKLL